VNESSAGLTSPASPGTDQTLRRVREPEVRGGRRYGWLGGKERRTELPSGVIQMGMRSYVPALGRFLPGGSADAYDYANQDPVNNFDLNGENCHPVRNPIAPAAESARTTRTSRSEQVGQEDAQPSVDYNSL
jgi:RHS repeat-associated protein